MRLRALDLFCGGGGAALGMMEAGFEVWGVDIEPKHSKVYPGHFVCGDATRPPFRLSSFDLVWASPPCQAFSRARYGLPRRCDNDLVGAIRDLISKHPFTVIENVPEAPIRCDVSLTGLQVGLSRLIRKRHFELSFVMLEPPRCLDTPGPFRLVTVSKSGGMGTDTRRIRRQLGLPLRFSKAESAEAMGLPMTMTQAQIGEAVPPAYAKLIAESARDLIEAH